MPTAKKGAKAGKKSVKVGDMKPKKDAKGGRNLDRGGSLDRPRYNTN